MTAIAMLLSHRKMQTATMTMTTVMMKIGKLATGALMMSTVVMTGGEFQATNPAKLHQGLAEACAAWQHVHLHFAPASWRQSN